MGKGGYNGGSTVISRRSLWRSGETPPSETVSVTELPSPPRKPDDPKPAKGKVKNKSKKWNDGFFSKRGLAQIQKAEREWEANLSPPRGGDGVETGAANARMKNVEVTTYTAATLRLDRSGGGRRSTRGR